MRGNMLLLLILFSLSISTLYINIGCSSTMVDTITSSQLIKDHETLSSNDNAFKLGFFIPPNTTNRYVGIWYLNQSNIIWVANRNQPLKDSSGVLTISNNNRNLVLLNRHKHIIWSSNVSTNMTSNSSNTTAQLLNTGNLVLLDDTTGNKIWESFKQPSDTFLPNIIISSNKITGEKVKLTSWKTPSDPSIGSFSASLDRLNAPEVFVWNQTQPYWRSGPWNGQIFLGLPGNLSWSYTSTHLNGFTLSREDNSGVVDIRYTSPNSSFFATIRVCSDGKFVTTVWINRFKVGQQVLQPSKCGIYGFCGPNGSCDMKNSPICSCLIGFEPRNVSEWNRQNWTSGCVRKTLLHCEMVKNGSELASNGNDGFLKLETTKVPDFGQQSDLSIDACRIRCLNNCSCSAYAFNDGIGCLIWSGKLIDIVKFSSGGIDLYLRQPYSELAIGIDGQAGTVVRKNVTVNVNVIIIPIVIVGTVIVAISTYFLWSCTTKRSGQTHLDIPSVGGPIGGVTQVKIEDLPLFDFENILSATNNFGLANKIGQGGFGSVYKGVLPDGQEIAVKRLSKASDQGVEELMNEVIVISKLQHRNLVRLLGCCIEGDVEKMLVYEYMPNNSLDFYLFDPIKKKVLNWEKRLYIIEGISRGLLYLHRDSRLRIIHRDLKPSNILLDGELNPKISDFGMAKIFGVSENEANTRRIVGTYGYMSPEYAMEGLFSEKSDVFSFGVLLLEIITGRKNTSFYNHEQSLNLLAYAWELWNEDKVVSLIDSEVCNQDYVNDILRCIHIGLLCVQEFAKDRPTMATVVSMLNSEIVNFPCPRQPAFILRQIENRGELSQQSHGLNSLNDVTVTSLQGR